MPPDLPFGKPASKGISTELLWKQTGAGQDVDEIADAFGEMAEVHSALAYETSVRGDT